MSSVLDYYGQSTALCFLIGFGLAMVVGHPSRDMPRSLMKGFTASTIPTGVVLIICAFDLSQLQFLGDLSLYVAVAGAVLIAVALEDLFPRRGGAA